MKPAIKSVPLGERLHAFAEVASWRHLGGPFQFWDTSDPENIRAAGEYFDRELMFLTGADRDLLRETWERAIERPEDAAFLFNVCKQLQDKYDPTYGTAAAAA